MLSPLIETSMDNFSQLRLPPDPLPFRTWAGRERIVNRVDDGMMPQRVITACEEHIEAETGLEMRLWEKCLLCGEKLAACTCANAQEPCLDCGEPFARCMCDGQ